MKASILSRLGLFYGLAKPERTLTNVMTAVAGYLFASQWHISWDVFLALAAGLTLVIASANVLNNFIDKDIDQQMERTQKRALPSGQISAAASTIYAAILGLLGFWVLSYTNWLTLVIVAIAYIWYVAIYGYAKRRTPHSTLIGTVPGGASLVAGYTAVTDELDKTAVFLFLIMVSWQMVHFYAIAVFRLKDYKAAKIPVLPLKMSLNETKIQMIFYSGFFIFATSWLTWEGYTGYIYLAVMLALGATWLRMVISGLNARDNTQWASGVFKFSLIVLLVMCAAIALGPLLP